MFFPTLFLEGEHSSGIEAEHFQTLSHANNENTGITVCQTTAIVYSFQVV